MFSVYCPRHGHNVLLGFDRLRSSTNVAPGVIVLQFRCTDGEVVHLVTGANASTHEASRRELAPAS